MHFAMEGCFYSYDHEAFACWMTGSYTKLFGTSEVAEIIEGYFNR
jgi:hypothetical protein